MNQNKPKPTFLCTPKTLTAEDLAEVDVYLAWIAAYDADPANYCECGGKIWRKWSVRNRHDAGAYVCRRCKKAHPEPKMWKDREAREI